MIQTVDARFPVPLQAPHHRGLILASRPVQAVGQTEASS
jgi:hypothetical protein